MASFSPDYALGVERARSYREEAKRLREKAAHASAPDIGRDLEDIARQYDLLAAGIEQHRQAREGLLSDGNVKETGK
jgi:hypothetical protein